MKMRPAVNLCVALIVFTSLAACKEAYLSERKTLEVAIQSGPITLDPRLATDAESEKICELLFDGLMGKNGQLNIVPNLAERYEQIDNITYRFFLRRGVLFHSGRPFNAKDVIYTYESIMKGELTSPFRESFSPIKAIVAEDDFTVRFELKEPYAPFLNLMTFGIVSQEDAKNLGDRFGREPLGTGPYRLVRFVPESVVELEANRGYFGQIPKISMLRLNVIKDDNIRILKLIKGDIDLVQNGIPPLLLPKVLETKGLKMRSDEGTVMTYLGMNLADKILKGAKVRQAIAYAVNRDEIIAHRFGGMATKADSILSPLNWAHPEGLRHYDYDPVKAGQLLDEAGYPVQAGGVPQLRFTLSHKTSTIKERIDIARMIAHQLKQVAVDVRVEPYEWGTFYRDVKSGNFQLYTLSWVGVTEPNVFFDVCHSSKFLPHGLNRGRYKNPRVDELVEQARVNMDQQARKTLYAEVQRILLEDLPFIPLWYEKNFVVYRKTLDGVSLRPDASYLTFVNVSKD